MDIMQRYEEWCKAFDDEMKVSIEPLSEELTLVLLRCAVMDMHAEKPPADLLSIGIVQIVLQRAEYMSLSTSPWVAIVMSACSPSPGACIMLLSYMKWKAQQLDIKHISVKEFSFMFPDGFLNPSAMEKMWRMQKMSDESGLNDNLLDVVSF